MMKLRHNENKIAFAIIASLLVLVAVLGFAYKSPKFNPRLEKANYSIVETWELPNQLNEISGITWLGNNELACIQDEDGIIFIFDLNTKMVERTINFAKGGDYEGITVVDGTAFILRSDGQLFEVSNFLSDDFEVKTYNTPFSGKHNMESLTYDKANNRLLIVPKDKDLEGKDYIGIYAFNLNNKQLNPLPILKIDFEDPIFDDKKDDDDKKTSNKFNPADIAIHPLNGNYYIVDGKRPKLLILDKNGKAIRLTKLIKDTFNQPEGIIFSPEGTMYISNEGKNGTANILEVELDD